MSKRRAMMIGLDGADPVIVKKLVAEGRMPNMKKILEKGVATESLDMLGVFPTVTPPNWATLATGNYPATHGVTCFLNHTLGKSLGITELNWDSRRVESELIWEAFEDEGKKCIMLNYCEAWPNRVEGSNNIFVDGTGVVPFLRSSVGFQKMVFMKDDYPTTKEVPHTVTQGSGDCVVYNDQVDEFAKKDQVQQGMTKEELKAAMGGSHFRTPPLEADAYVMYDVSAEEAANADNIDKLYSPIKEAKNWGFDVPSNAKEALITMNNSLTRRYALLTASNGKDFDTITLYASKKEDKPMAVVPVGQWSKAIIDVFSINDSNTKVAYYIRAIDLAADGSEGKFYISHVMNLEDDSYYYPKSVHKDLLEAVGPMCYFATFDRHTKAGDDIALEAFDLVNDWHMRATAHLFDSNPDWQLFYIHLHSIDLCNHWYINEAVDGSHPEWQRHARVIEEIYEINDKYLKTVLDYMDDNTSVVVTSDHAAIPRSAGYHNPGIGELSGINTKVMSDLGFTKVNPIPGMEGMYTIDWTQTKAINHRTSHIYINLKGRDPDGIVEPEDYEATVQEVISALYGYRDPKSGDRVVSFAMTREEMKAIGMGGDHCGDIFFQLTRNFGMEHANTPNDVTNEGYSVGCLCVMAGAGFKQGQFIKRPVRNVDIVPTLCHLVGNRMPHDVEGGIVYQALSE